MARQPQPHEMRDILKSLLHTRGKAKGFDLDCAEFWLGHTTDALGYDKFFNDEKYMREQFTIAEPFLNIISNPPLNEASEKQADDIRELRQIIDEQRETNQFFQEQIAVIQEATGIRVLDKKA